MAARVVRHLDLQHQQCDRDREHPVAESLDSSRLIHSCPPVGKLSDARRTLAADAQGTQSHYVKGAAGVSAPSIATGRAATDSVSRFWMATFRLLRGR